MLHGVIVEVLKYLRSLNGEDVDIELQKQINLRNDRSKLSLIRSSLVFPSTKNLTDDVRESDRSGVLIGYVDFERDLDSIKKTIEDGTCFNKLQSKELTLEVLEDLRLYKDANFNGLDFVVIQRVRTPILCLKNMKNNESSGYWGTKQSGVSGFIEMNEFKQRAKREIDMQYNLIADVAVVISYSIPVFAAVLSRKQIAKFIVRVATVPTTKKSKRSRKGF